MRGAGVTEISSLEFKGQTRSMQDTVPEGQRLLTALLAASDIAYAWNVRSGAIEWLSDPAVLGAQFASIRNADSLAARIHVSLATVYNTLNQFKTAGLLREVAFEGDRTFFDTNTSNHFHYYLEETDSLVDIGTSDLEVLGLPPLPPGTEIDRVDIIIRLRKTDR